MDRQLTFEILLYLNIFFTSFYGCMEAFFLLMKYIYVPDFGKCLDNHKIFSWIITIISTDALTLLNEMFLLLILGGFEAARLYLGQQDNLQKKISVVFRILVLTVPGRPYNRYNTLKWPAQYFSSVSDSLLHVLADKDNPGGHDTGDDTPDRPTVTDVLCLHQLSSKQTQNMF